MSPCPLRLERCFLNRYNSTGDSISIALFSCSRHDTSTPRQKTRSHPVPRTVTSVTISQKNCVPAAAMGQKLCSRMLSRAVSCFTTYNTIRLSIFSTKSLPQSHSLQPVTRTHTPSVAAAAIPSSPQRLAPVRLPGLVTLECGHLLAHNLVARVENRNAQRDNLGNTG